MVSDAVTNPFGIPIHSPRGLRTNTRTVVGSSSLRDKVRPRMSNDRLYYLSGDSEVRYLAPDGATGVATHIPGSGHVHAAFAVNADDSRIAVTAVDYSTSPVSVRLYVEDLNGGGNHKDLYSVAN